VSDLSWPHVSLPNPTPEQRAERALNLMHGKNMWNGFMVSVIAAEIREAQGNGVAPLMVQADLEHPRKDTGGESLLCDPQVIDGFDGAA
jgi:hypothetical protein